MAGWYELRTSDDGTWNFILKATTGHVLLRSEHYSSRPAAKLGITAVKANCQIAERYERKRTADERYYFILKAANDEVIGTSQPYRAGAALAIAIANVKAEGKRDTVQVSEYVPPSPPTTSPQRPQPSRLALRNQPIVSFISYTREKDAYDSVVSKFRDRLVNELRLRDRTAEVFLDKSAISAGTSFPTAIENALTAAEVLVVLLSPAWLQSSWCRKELTQFMELKGAQGRFPAVLPLLWVSVDFGKYRNDELATFLKPIQYRDWRELRKKDWQSTALRNELDHLADAILNLSGRA